MPGYDADDESVPPNKVIFDSNSVANVSILRRGTRLFAANTNSNSEVTLASWNLNFVPLCHSQFVWGPDSRKWEWSPLRSLSGSQSDSYAPHFNYLRATTTGLFVRFYGAPAYDVTLHWTAYNLAVV